MQMERRRHKRWQITVPVRELRPEHHVMRATSISVGGMLCPDAAPRTEGSSMTLELDLTTSGRPVTVEARVVHAGKWEGFGLGLEFSQPVDSLAAFLEQLSPAAK